MIKKTIEEENIIVEDDSRKISYHKIFKVAGVTFPCMLNSETNRQEILEDCSESFTYYLQEYRYKGKLAYLVICKELGADIGTVPKEFVNTIVKYAKYEKRDTAIQCNKIDCFEPDNESNGKTIYYAKMQFIVYAK